MLFFFVRFSVYKQGMASLSGSFDRRHNSDDHDGLLGPAEGEDDVYVAITGDQVALTDIRII